MFLTMTAWRDINTGAHVAGVCVKSRVITGTNKQLDANNQMRSQIRGALFRSIFGGDDRQECLAAAGVALGSNLSIATDASPSLPRTLQSPVSRRGYLSLLSCTHLYLPTSLPMAIPEEPEPHPRKFAAPHPCSTRARPLERVLDHLGPLRPRRPRLLRATHPSLS